MCKRLAAALCVLALGAPLSARAQDEGDGRPTERRFEDDPRVVSPPLLMGPLYACAQAVGVRGFVPHAKVIVFVNGSYAGAGEGADPNGLQISISPELKAGDVVTATQEVNGTVSPESADVVVRDHTLDYPNGLPASKIYPPPLYRCGIATASRDHLPGSRIELYQQPFSGSGAFTPIGGGYTSHAWTWTYVSPSFSVSEAITTRYFMCADKSPMSYEGIVQPEPATIGAPTVAQVYEGAELVPVSGLLNGSHVEVSVNGASRGGTGTCCASTNVQVTPELAAGETVTAAQKLCNGGPDSPGVTVKPCSALPPPKVRAPEIGETSIEVIESQPGAHILVYDAAGQEIGDGGGALVALTRAVLPGDVLTIVQKLGSCTGALGFTVSAVCKAGRTFADPSATGLYAVGRADYALPAVNIGGDSVRRIAHVRFPADVNGGRERGLAPYGGKFPLVMVMHGNHGVSRLPSGQDICPLDPSLPETPNHRGYDYVLDALARSGYIAVSINANDLNCKNDRILERGDLMLEHLALWKTFQDAAAADPAFGGMFHGRVDLTKIGLMGHSRGGEAVVAAAQNNGDPDLGVRAVLSLAPTDFHGIRQEVAPLLMILPAADGDVWDNQGARIYDRAAISKVPAFWKSQLYVYGADHNQFNRTWTTPDGTGASLMTRTEQERMLRAFTRSFFDHWLDGALGYRGVFAGDAVIAGLQSERVFPSFEQAGAVTLDDHEDGATFVNTLGGGLASSFASFAQFPFVQGGGAYNGSFFHETDGLVTTWSRPASYSSDVPGAFGDVTPFRFLSFRVTQINDRLNASGADTNLDIGVRAAGQARQVNSASVGVIPFPYDHGALTDKSMLRTLRVPFACLMAGREALDPRKLEQVFFATTAASGAIGYDQLSFSN